MTKELSKTDSVDQDAIEKVVQGLINNQRGSKQDQFYLYHFFGLPIKTCAELAGYSEAYGYKLIQKFKKNPIKRQGIEKILNLIPEQYRMVCKARLVDLADIEGQALNEYRKDPRLYIKSPQVGKQIKQGAGILSNDDTPPVQVINIRKLQQIMQTAQEQKVGQRERIVDAEIIEGKD